MTKRIQRWAAKMTAVVALSGLGMGTTGCESNAGNGALIGGAAGAGLGAIIGNNSHHHTAGGALIGGAIGAIGGGLIGNEMDKNEARERYRYDNDHYQERGRVYYDDGPPPPPPPSRYEYRHYEP